MTKMQAIETTVTDKDERVRGVMDVQVEFDMGLPSKVIHERHTYRATGRKGVDMVTAKETLEMATDGDARLWITVDGTQLWED